MSKESKLEESAASLNNTISLKIILTLDKNGDTVIVHCTILNTDDFCVAWAPI